MRRTDGLFSLPGSPQKDFRFLYYYFSVLCKYLKERILKRQHPSFEAKADAKVQLKFHTNKLFRNFFP